MFGYDDVKTVSVVISDPTSDATYPILRVPTRMTKIEVLRAWAEVDTTITLGSGTGIALTLLVYGSEGTGLEGTVSSILGGTTITWTAETPKTFSLSDGTMDADEYLRVKYDESGTVAPLNITIGIDYVSGVGA